MQDLDVPLGGGSILGGFVMVTGVLMTVVVSGIALYGVFGGMGEGKRVQKVKKANG